LTQDLKRAIAESKSSQGLINVVSTQATTSLILLENDDNIKKELLEQLKGLFWEIPEKKVVRRSASGADKYHLMAAQTGLTLTLPFAEGRLLTNPQHEVFALDFEPRAGRREFVVAVLSPGGQTQK
jgi:thiamine phosphate synthase YjbQ (UPF0047 family)